MKRIPSDSVDRFYQSETVPEELIALAVIKSRFRDALRPKPFAVHSTQVSAWRESMQTGSMSRWRHGKRLQPVLDPACISILMWCPFGMRHLAVADVPPRDMSPSFTFEVTVDSLFAWRWQHERALCMCMKTASPFTDLTCHPPWLNYPFRQFSVLVCVSVAFHGNFPQVTHSGIEATSR
jgi:hypothetical protein